MPMIELQALPQGIGQERLQELLSELAHIASDSLKAPLKAVFVVFRPIEAGCYMHEDSAIPLQTKDSHPPLLRISAFVGRTGEQIAECLRRCAESIELSLGLESGNVFASYVELQSGHVLTGGILRRQNPTV